jgi:hypothetical protein
MTTNTLQINKTDTQLTIQFPQGEKIPFMHLLIHWLTLTIAVFSLFLLLYFLRWQWGPWFVCSFLVTYCFLPYYFFMFTPMVFLWNYTGFFDAGFDTTGLWFSESGKPTARRRRSFKLDEIESVRVVQTAHLPFWARWWGSQLLVLLFRGGFFRGGLLEVENKHRLAFHFGWNVTPKEAEEVARLMNEHLALLKGN